MTKSFDENIFYLAKKPCKNGHKLKYIKSNCCVECHRDNARRRRQELREKSKEKIPTHFTKKLTEEIEIDRIRNKALSLFR